MKIVPFLFFLLACFLLPLAGHSQAPFQSCTAAFLDQKMVVNEYSPDGKCVLSADAKGTLNVCTVYLSATEQRAVDRLPFRLAIRDGNSKTLLSFSNDTYRQIDVRKVLARCRPGDSIVLLTLDDAYALPHNEILVQ